MQQKIYTKRSPSATVFEFVSYKFEPTRRKVFFNYKTEFSDKKPLFFTETIVLPKAPDLKDIPKELIDKLLEGLHIILGISYYKLYCAPKLAFGKPGSRPQSGLGTTKVSLPYSLSKQEADFWNTVYKKGLGEFFYKNNLDPKISPEFPYKKKVKTTHYSLPTTYYSLVAIGGGKDSIVASELLKDLSRQTGNNFDFDTFFVKTSNKSKLIENIAEIIGKKSLTVKRILDPKVFEKHQFGGHIPISAIYAFLGIFSAVLYRYSYFIVSNEYSSNFGNLKYKGLTINHQWSKSFEFERLFQDYLKNFVSPNVFYFSLLRHLYEIRIVKLFSKYKKYFPYFSSCNNNFKMSLKENNGGLWCGICSKCVFVFTLLSAFMTRKELIKIFGKNLYEDKNLIPLFKDVLGFGKVKPFDCVGTFKEAQSAMHLVKKRFKNDFIIKELSKRTKFYSEVFKTQKESSVPEQFKFLGIDNALILGYGKEGQITEKYLKKYYPKLKISIADEKQGKNYLKNQSDFDIAVKTPGIKKELVKIPYTTATNIFLSKLKNRNLIIGVTGSKGKSTTSSLIYHILRTAGKNVELLGNIGKPMLERLLKPVNKNTIFVLELSSYQLDDIKFSPDIAVVTNLFPEHIDYHNGTKSYYQAKKNIINFQGKGNYFIYYPKNKIMKSWLNNYQGRPVKFFKSNLKNNLIGEHNKSNIGAAVAVAKILSISDDTIKSAVKNFKGLPHRLEFVGEHKGIKFYDDAISTTPESTIMAIKALKNIDTILLGGEDRGYNFSDLERTIKKYKIRNIVLFPNSGRKIIKSKNNFNILHTKSMRDSVRFAYKNTKKGSVCLLSCASPSYSLWKNFEEKGDQFKKFIKRLSK